MKRTLMILGVAAALLSGCVARTASSPPASNGSSSSPTSMAYQPLRISIPTMDFVDANAFAKGINVSAGTVVPPGGYTAFLSGKRLQSVEWGAGGSLTAPQTMLLLVFDAAGTDTLDQWSRAHVGGSLAVVLDHRIIEVASVDGPIPVGSVGLTDPEVLALRSRIDSDTVRSR